MPLLRLSTASEAAAPVIIPGELPPAIQRLQEALAWFGAPFRPLVRVIREKEQINPLLLSLNTLLSKTPSFPVTFVEGEDGTAIATWAAWIARLQHWGAFLQEIQKVPGVQLLPKRPAAFPQDDSPELYVFHACMNAPRKTESGPRLRDLIYLDNSGHFRQKSKHEERWLAALARERASADGIRVLLMLSHLHFCVISDPPTARHRVSIAACTVDTGAPLF